MSANGRSGALSPGARSAQGRQVTFLRALIAAAVLAGLAACALEPQPGLTDVMQRPAERALLAGLRAYEDAQYADAERELQRALGAGLASAKDRAAAHKHLAFIFCTSHRLRPCEAAFRAAIAADREFALSRAEAGHPQWGPVYRRIAAEK